MTEEENNVCKIFLFKYLSIYKQMVSIYKQMENINLKNIIIFIGITVI